MVFQRERRIHRVLENGGKAVWQERRSTLHGATSQQLRSVSQEAQEGRPPPKCPSYSLPPESPLAGISSFKKKTQGRESLEIRGRSEGGKQGRKWGQMRTVSFRRHLDHSGSNSALKEETEAGAWRKEKENRKGEEPPCPLQLSPRAVPAGKRSGRQHLLQITSLRPGKPHPRQTKATGSDSPAAPGANTPHSYLPKKRFTRWEENRESQQLSFVKK